MKLTEEIFYLRIAGVPRYHVGKVRDLFDLGEHILIISSDRVSAHDVVLPNEIPNKGKILNHIALYWFDQTKNIFPNHVVHTDSAQLGVEFEPYLDKLQDRFMVVRKAAHLPIEFVVRGYLAGSGWKEYQSSGKVCEIQLPAGLKQSEKLPEPIFTPATKADSGHDINISFDEMAAIIGSDLAHQLKEVSLKIYKHCSDIALIKGLILADTKFEFGRTSEGQVILIDEVCTPDSSRYWDAKTYEAGKPQDGMDKQIIRDYLNSLAWDKTWPAPNLPSKIVQASHARYIEAYKRIIGKLPPWEPN